MDVSDVKSLCVSDDHELSISNVTPLYASLGEHVSPVRLKRHSGLMESKGERERIRE